MVAADTSPTGGAVSEPEQRPTAPMISQRGPGATPDHAERIDAVHGPLHQAGGFCRLRLESIGFLLTAVDALRPRSEVLKMHDPKVALNTPDQACCPYQ